MSDWCILRTSGRGTLRLAESLTRDGIEAWTPSALIERRRPRSRAKSEKPVPIMPSYVFASARHLERIMLLAERPGSHDAFSLFHYFGGIALCADKDLEPLRSAEKRALPKSRQRGFRPGQTVRVPEGSFGGMSGIVERSDGGYTMVCFGGSIRVKIATFLLRSAIVQDGQPQGIAA